MAERLGLVEGIPVDLQVEGDTIFIRRKKYDLEMLLSQVTAQNKHGEINTGQPKGRESW
jgi:antitoxin MazE